MAKNISKITINSPLENVWEVLTKPEYIKKWQYGSDLHTTWKVGSEIKFTAEWDGKVFEQWGTVLEFSPHEKLRYSLFAPIPGLDDKPENYFEMIYILTEAVERTQLEIIQLDNRPHAVQEAEQGEENVVLKMLRHVAETI